jgi:hypothetical protein
MSRRWHRCRAGVGWLLDNYVVQEHLQEAQPACQAGTTANYLSWLRSLTGYPRVYEVAITLIAHRSAHDLQNVDLFVGAFQAPPLTVGELWAMPAMLRIGLISVRRMTLRSCSISTNRLAAHWADRSRRWLLPAAPVSATRCAACGADNGSRRTSSRGLALVAAGEGASPPLSRLELAA